jgi:hypothetical protein
LVTKGDLESMPAPQGTETWFPVRHLDVLEAVEETIDGANFQVKSCQLSVSKQNHRFFGILDLISDLAEGVSLSVGIRNSNDKTFPIGFCIGNRTFVCDNLSFSSEIIISKRHTRFGEDRFREGISSVVAKLQDYRQLEAKRIELLQEQPFTDERAESTVLRAWDKGIVGTRMLRPLLDEWREPSFEEFQSRTAWSMLSAYTHIAKDRQSRYPNKAAWEVMQFQQLLAV